MEQRKEREEGIKRGANGQVIPVTCGFTRVNYALPMPVTHQFGKQEVNGRQTSRVRGRGRVEVGGRGRGN